MLDYYIENKKIKNKNYNNNNNIDEKDNINTIDDNVYKYNINNIYDNVNNNNNIIDDNETNNNLLGASSLICHQVVQVLTKSVRRLRLDTKLPANTRSSAGEP